MRKKTRFEVAMHAFVTRQAFNYSERDLDRGYATDGHKFWLNGVLLAQWHDGAARMYLNDPRWHSYLYAQALPKVRKLLRQAGVLAERDEFTCKEHEDCRLHANLGEACARARTSNTSRPMPLAYFEKLEAFSRTSGPKGLERGLSRSSGPKGLERG